LICDRRKILNIDFKSG